MTDGAHRTTSGITDRKASTTGAEALRRTGLLDTAPEVRFDRITRLARDVLDVPVCLVSLIDRERQFFKSVSGLPEPWASRRETPLSHSFCKHVVESAQSLTVTNAETDDRVIDNLAIRELGVTAYLGVPIHSEGFCIGSLCAIDSKPRLWKTSELERLQDFGAIIDGEIELRRFARERDQARQEAELLAHEHSHRVKNSLSVAASLVTISASEARSVEELTKIARDRISALASAQNLAWTAEGAGELKSLLDSILGPYRLSGDRIIRLEGESIYLPQEKVTPLSLIFHELATNASKYGALRDAGGGIELDWKTEEDRLAIRWSERLPTMAGRPASQLDPRVELDGVEATDSVAGKDGFGTRLVGLCVRQLAGEIEIGRGPGGGRQVALTLPWPRGSALV